MKLLLAFLLTAVLIGLLSERYDGRMGAALMAAVMITTVLYFTFQRFMSI